VITHEGTPCSASSAAAESPAIPLPIIKQLVWYSRILSYRLNIHRKVERRRGVGQPAHADVVDSCLRYLANVFESHSARNFNPASPRDYSNGLFHLGNRHIVQHDHIGWILQQRLELF